MTNKSITGILKHKLHLKDTKAEASPQSPEPTKEEVAAIALALQLYIRELQDRDNMTLTIKQVSRIYSPWSSKIYGVSGWPRMR
jgi:hypothetical protein